MNWGLYGAQGGCHHLNLFPHHVCKHVVHPRQEQMPQAPTSSLASPSRPERDLAKVSADAEQVAVVWEGSPKTERNRWPSDVNSQYTFWRLTGTGDHNLSLQKRPGLKGRSERQPVLESWTRACFLTLPLGYIWAFSPRRQCVHKSSFVGQQRPCDCSR